MIATRFDRAACMSRDKYKPIPLLLKFINYIHKFKQGYNIQFNSIKKNNLYSVSLLLIS